MASVLTEVSFDCENPERVCQFWCSVLGWKATQAENGLWWASATGDYTARPMFVFVPVPEKKTVKDRIHVDVSPQGVDQAEELERLLALGATRLDVGQPADVPWVVLADIEGNEFCLLGRRVD
ncbi:MAG: VOC family protein [Actinobacteria bacterium]|nr:VOC family protein [Actinomycetota bacterium]